MIAAIVLFAVLLVFGQTLVFFERQRWAHERARLVAAALAPTPQQAQAALIAQAAHADRPKDEPRHYPPAVGED